MTIKEFVHTYIDQSIQSLPFETTTKKMVKGAVVTDYNQLEDSVYFIQSGILTTSLIYKDEERVLDFYFEGSFCASYSSLLSKNPSDIRITCYTDCLLEVVNYDELKRSYQTSLLANQLGRIATEKLFLERVTREKELLTMTAEERYQSLLDDKPELVQKIAIKDLSKYLGVRPESLSRIRRK
ncbi:MAG: Crp/Fnr family transcriptional regulator [Bacteroidota bacterium]